MNYLLIACDVFKEFIEHFTNQMPHKITSRYLKLEAHLEPKKLHQEVQDIIDQAEGELYDVILLGYGLCGNATDGITARSIPIVIPKAHDCCTLFLGSIDRFIECFGENLSAQWTSSSYLAKSNGGMYSIDGQYTMGYFGLGNDFEEIVKEYGEDNAEYLWSILHPTGQNNKEVIYISTNSSDDERNIKELKQKADEEGKEFKMIQGDLRLIENLFKEGWGEEYVFLLPGESIKSTNDLDTVLKATKLPKSEKKIHN